jgi:hypothetical protein
MGAHKLDIEFEDEDEVKAQEAESAKKKQVEAQHAEAMGELEFDLSDDDVAAPATEDIATPAPAKAPAKPQQQQPPARAQAQAAPQAQSSNVSTGAYMNASPGAVNYNLGDELRGVIAGNRILEIELQAKIEIAVTHRLTTIIAENAQGNKVLENKVNKVLAQVAARVPALKKELTMIKRMLAEHAAVDKEKFHSETSEAKQKPGAPAAARPAPAAAKKKAS